MVRRLARAVWSEKRLLRWGEGQVNSRSAVAFPAALTMCVNAGRKVQRGQEHARAVAISRSLAGRVSRLIAASRLRAPDLPACGS